MLAKPTRPSFFHTVPRTLLLFERNFDWRITGRWMFYSALVGVVVAMASLVFALLVRGFTQLALVDAVGYSVPLPSGEADQGPFDLAETLRISRRWLLFVVPAVGGLLTGWIVTRFAPEAEGHGTDAVIRAFHRQHSLMSPRIPVVKTIASALTIGTGGSAGREGPIAQIGAALASRIAVRLRLSERERRILLVAGVAAGVGAIFRSPLGGAFFAVEVLYREDIETEALMPAVVSSITAYSLYSSLTESGAVFTTPGFQFVHPVELLPLILFALVCALVGILFVDFFYATRTRVFDPLSMPLWAKPALGGLIVGAIGYLFPPVLGSSYGWLQQAIDGTLPLWIMGTLVLAKIVATSVTIGSGGSGGVFAPSMVIGGMLGGVFGMILHDLMPRVVTQPGAYVMIGMAMFFSGVANVPISTAIMISELTGSYTLLVPLLFGGVLVHVVSRRWSLYREQVRSFNDSPVHSGEAAAGLLKKVRVDSVVEYPVHYHVLEPSHTLPEILDVFTRTREVVLAVLDPDAEQQEGVSPYSGLVLLEDVQSLLASDEALGRLVVAADVRVPFEAVRLDDTLDHVMEVFARTNYPELPVLGEDGVITGFIRQGQVISEYHRAYLRAKG